MATDMYQPHIQVLKSMMAILRSVDKSESLPVTAKIVKNSAGVGIRIFVESGLEGRLIVKTTVRFLDHFVCPFGLGFVRCFRVSSDSTPISGTALFCLDSDRNLVLQVLTPSF